MRNIGRSKRIRWSFASLHRKDAIIPFQGLRAEKDVELVWSKPIATDNQIKVARCVENISDHVVDD